MSTLRYLKLITLTLCLCSVVGWLAWIGWQQHQLDINLITAIQHGQYTHAISLLNKGANPNARKAIRDVSAPLWQHIRNPFVPDQNIIVDDRQTALMLVFDPDEHAARYHLGEYTYPKEATDLIRTLLVKGADANAMDRQGRYVLHYALRYKHYEGVQLLIQHGADVNLRNDKGVSLLTNVKSDHDKRLVQILTQAGAKE